jgi:hypothetical protein
VRRLVAVVRLLVLVHGNILVLVLALLVVLLIFLVIYNKVGKLVGVLECKENDTFP